MGDIEHVIPLFLEGAAFSVYEQMNECDKDDSETIEKVLCDAFALNNFQAYDLLRQRLAVRRTSGCLLI